jgi:hypothetical protein
MFFAPTLEQLEKLNPGHGCFDAHGNEGTDRMLPLFARRWAMVMHLKAVPADAGELQRYVPSCWECMVSRGIVDEIRKGLVAAPPPLGHHRTGWDGLALLHLTLPEPKDRWVKAIRAAYGLAP